MAFVVLQSDEAYAEWMRLSLAMGYGHTRLAGKGGRAVLAVPDIALDELAARQIAYEPLSEAQLPGRLTQQGLDMYRRLRRHRPDHLYFNAPLPAALHVTLACTVAEPYAEAVRQIVQRYEPVEYRATEVSVHSIPTEPDRAIEVRPMVRIEFVVPRTHHQALVEELLASGAAGSSRETAIYVQSDPDGPPRGTGGGGRGH